MNQKNVLVIEMGGSHIECVYSLVHFLYERNCRLHLICNEKLEGLFPEKHKLEGLATIANELPGLSQQLKCFFFIRKYIRTHKIDAVMINTTEITIVRNLTFFLPKGIVVGLVHNAIKLEKSFTFTKILSRRIKKFLVLGDHLLQHIHPHPVFKVRSFYPVYFPPVKKLLIEKPAGSFWVVVPGEVFSSRRDYIPLLQLLKEHPLPEHIKIIFLGRLKPSDPAYEMAKEQGGANGSLICFEDYVSYDVFHSYLALADMIMPLIKQDGDDFYADKRISGSFNLGLGYQLPFILPLSFQLNKDLSPFGVLYNSTEEILPLLKSLSSENTTTLTGIKEQYRHSRFDNLQWLSLDLYRFIFEE